MASLSSKTVVQYVPSLPGNKESQEPLSFSVTCGLSVLDNERWLEAINPIDLTQSDEKIIEDFNNAFRGVVSLNGAHTIDGRPVTSVGEYCAIMGRQHGAPLIVELVSFVGHHNSVKGIKEVFCVRSFGGTPSMAEEGK